MKHYIYGGHAGHYKANLHAHSTVSDGRLTPSELKALYKKHGYSVLCITDHELMRPHPELDDDSFLALTGYEIAINDGTGREFSHCKTMHLNVYSPVQDNDMQVMFHPDDVSWLKNRGVVDLNAKYYGEPVKKTYSTECFNRIIAEAASHGYIVSMNHPTWSMLEEEDYRDLDGLFAVEIYNHGCVAGDGTDDNTPVVYDYMNRHGKKIFCTAVDDNHNAFPEGHVRFDSLGGFDVINAPSLEYGEIFSALKNGNFYASTGALIDEIYVEDGKVHVKCPPCNRIMLINNGRRTEHAVRETGSDRGITEAVFSVKDTDMYVRIEVMSDTGHAYSQPFYPLSE